MRFDSMGLIGERLRKKKERVWLCGDVKWTEWVCVNKKGGLHLISGGYTYIILESLRSFVLVMDETIQCLEFGIIRVEFSEAG